MVIGTLAHYHVHGLKVALLIGHRSWPERRWRASTVLGHDHLTDRLDAVALKEHVLGTAQADALSAEVDGLLGIAGVVGVGKDLQTANAVSPAHKAAKVTGNGRIGGGDGLAVNAAGGTIDGNASRPRGRSCRPG